MNDKIKFNVSMEVTLEQALALRAFFEKWNELAGRGASRYVGFFVDGDGNFKPKCQVDCKEIETLYNEDDEFKYLAHIAGDGKPSLEGVSGILYDYDNIAWYYRNKYED